MSIYKGSTLLAGNVSNGDAVTINTNSNDLLQAIGTINKNTSSFNYKYDWVGTFAQWQAQAIATTHPEWVCYIIDDSYDGVSVPTGTILPFGGVNAPEGFLICDGSAISRTTYSKLFNVIGESYGSGDGNSTFNIPNSQDRSVLFHPTSRGNYDGSLPEITGNTGNPKTLTNSAEIGTPQGAFYVYSKTTNDYGHTSQGSQGRWALGFDAKRCSEAYRRTDNKVLPTSIFVGCIIKY